MSKINIHYYDETYIQITCEDRGILEELSEYFEFFVPNYQYNPKYIYGAWSGKIHLFRRANQTIYRGLMKRVIKFCLKRKYPVWIDPKLKNKNNDFNAEEYIKTLGIEKIQPYEYQISAIEKMVKDQRGLILSPTNSGKSFIMYSVLRFLLDNTEGKILLLVPTVALTIQLEKEFKNYSQYDIEKHVHKIYEGQSKTTDKRLIISTWQSMQTMPKKYFEQFTAIMGDEAHGITASECKKIFESCINAEYRYGLTGTIKYTETHILVLEGLTGDICRTTTNKEMQDKGRSSKLIIKAMNLIYPNGVAKEVKKKKTNKNGKGSPSEQYMKELKFIQTYTPRNNLITTMCKKITNENILILTQFVNHAKLLKQILEKEGKTVVIVTGEVKGDKREDVREFTEKNNGIVIIATYGVFSTGISINNLQHLFFATPYKTEIKVLQSIGRMLRLDGKKNIVYLYDLVDNFQFKERNILYKHFFERWKIYTSEQFEKSVVNINIK